MSSKTEEQKRRILEYERRYWALPLNREKKLKYLREWYKRNRIEWLKILTLRRRELKLKIFEAGGGICARCGFSDFRALQIDHIDGGGRKMHKFMRSDSYLRAVLKSLREGKREYQILCANCNWIKRFENGE